MALFKAMLLSVWYNLSDVKLAGSLGGRASFRRFRGFTAHEATPERTDLACQCPRRIDAAIHPAPEPGAVYADMGYGSHANREAIHATGGQQRIAQRSAWGRDPEAARAALNAWNASVAAVRCRIEKVFGTWKRSYGLARMRFIGLAKASLQVHFTAIAYNLRRA